MGSLVGKAVAEDTEASESSEVRRPAMATPSLSRFLMIFLGLMAIFALIDPGMSLAFGELAGFILFPTIGFGGRYPVITILLAGLLTTTISSVIRDHYTDWIKMVRVQKTMAAWRKAQMEAIRKGNQAELAKLKAIQQSFMKDSMDVQTAPLKSMAWTFFLFIVLFTWLRFFVDNILGSQGNMYIAVPWSAQVYLSSLYVFPSWVLLYSLLAIPFGQIITRVLKYVRFRRKLEAMGLSTKAEPGGPA